MEKNIISNIRKIVEFALKEDIGKGDLTSLACLEPKPITASITAKSEGVISGIKPLLIAFDIVDSANTVRPVKQDGDNFSKGDVIAEIEGLNLTVLTAERTALNFLGRLSGIATLTNRFVEKIKKTNCKILDTRKTTPGLRVLEKDAVMHGGGENHRIGLYDMILIKDNHIKSAGSIRDAVELARTYLNSTDFRLQFDTDAKNIEIEVEVSSEAQLKEAIECGIMRILLDNQSEASLKKMVEITKAGNPEIKLEASGNVSLDNVAATAQTGVDYISIGALTHSAVSSDFSLNLTE